jgi:hypothetical protein
MMRMYIDVALSAAIKAGRTQSGWLSVEITDDILAAFSESERASLASRLRVVDGQIRLDDRLLGSTSPKPGVAEATPEALSALVKWLTVESRDSKPKDEEAKAQKDFEDEVVLHGILKEASKAFLGWDDQYLPLQRMRGIDIDAVAARLGLADVLARCRRDAQHQAAITSARRQEQRKLGEAAKAAEAEEGTG